MVSSSSFKTHLLFAFILSCDYLAGSVTALEVSEAAQIALESGELLPSENVVQRIEKDLLAIRNKYSQYANVKHTPKWKPGILILSDATKQNLEVINSSPYGPVEAKPIFQEIIYLLTFTKPYNPEKLADLLEKKYGIKGAEPDSTIGGSSSITLTCDQSGNNSYVFFIGDGDCPAGCINRRYITFIVTPDQTSVELVKDTADGNGSNDPNAKDHPVGVGGRFGLQ